MVMGVCGVMFLVLGRQIAGLFDPEPEVVSITSNLLLIAAGFQILDGVSMVQTGALNGAGDTRFVMVVNLVSAWLVLVPLGYVLCVVMGWGAPGAWLALTVQVLMLASLTLARWRGQRPLRLALQRQATEPA
jgi:multidrug resistance protein, MATE family